MGFAAACSIRNILGRHGRRSSVRILDDHLAKTAVELVRSKHRPARFPVKQAQSVEIAYLMSGGVISQRRLSRRGEWRAAVAAFALVAGMSVASALLVGVALLAAHRVVYATPYLLVWLLAGAGAATLAAVRAARRARCYGIGTDIDDDAFAAVAATAGAPHAGRLRDAAGPGNDGTARERPRSDSAREHHRRRRRRHAAAG